MATLQGIWTDDRQCPAFKSNLHADLEVQAQYQTYQTFGNFEAGEEFLDFMWDLLPVFREFAGNYFETKGANVPTCLTWGGNPTGDHQFYEACYFCLSWRLDNIRRWRFGRVN